MTKGHYFFYKEFPIEISSSFLSSFTDPAVVQTQKLQQIDIPNVDLPSPVDTQLQQLQQPLLHCLLTQKPLDCRKTLNDFKSALILQ